jgi:anti-sigma factor (TIGR02949 family)
MNGCARAREQIQAYLDGELETTERVAVETHLAACPDCRRLADSYRSLFTALDRSAAPEPAPGFAARVLGRVAAARARRRRWQTLVAAAAVLLLSTAAMLWAWDDLPAAAWDHVADLGRVELWAAAADAVTEFAAGVSVAGEAGLAAVPGTPALAVLVLSLLVLNLALAYRWRALAHVNGSAEARAVR